MFAIIKDIHNIIRWLVLFAGIWAVARAWWGLFVHREWTSWDRRAGVLFSSSLDLQLLLGVILYIFSPLIRVVFQDFGAAMGAAGLRFFALDHVIFTLLAVLVAHLGSLSTKKAPTTRTRFARAALLFTLALVLLLLGIPWPWMAVGRPWLPGL
jgi:hypothetical protein